MKRLYLGSILLSALFLFAIIRAGCSYDVAREVARADGFAVENYDSALRPHVYHYSEHPKRIVALWQNSIETLLALGAADRIIVAGGVSNTDVLAPENVSAYETIPLRLKQVPDVETMLTLQPDLIVGWLFDFTRQGNGVGRSDFWEKRGTNVYMTTMNGAEFKDVHTLEDELRFIRDLGTIVDREERAAEIEQEIRAEMTPVMQGKRRRVLVVSSVARQLTIYTPRTLAGDILEKLGAEVLGADRQMVGEDEFISYEQLLLLDPDVIFVQSVSPHDQGSRERLLANPALHRLRAVREGHIYSVPFYLMRCPGVRVLDGIRCFKRGLQEAAASEGDAA